MPSTVLWIDAASLSNASAAYLDSDLTICAPNGYYSDGNIVRQQVNCVLLPQEICPSCLTPCGQTINQSGSKGIYRIELNTSNNLGAIRIVFNASLVPDGIRAFLGSNSYNKVSSSVGVPSIIGAQALPGHFTIVGNSSQTCVPFTSQSFDLFEYNGLSFFNTGTSSVWQIDPLDVFLTNPEPLKTTLVVPKQNTIDNVLVVEIIGPCTSVGWNIEINCPIQLLPYLRSGTTANQGDACLEIPETDYYFVSVAQVYAPTVIGVGDFAFTDPNGADPLPDGFYNVNNAGDKEIIEVVNGMVIATYDCP